jgi:uncharacterized damage-inducible protein DinB
MSTTTVRNNEIATAFLAEFEQEVATTKRFLQRVPENQLNWRPHEKSMTAGQLALHIAQVPEAVLRFVEPDQTEAPEFGKSQPQPATVQEILDTLENGAAYVRQTLPNIDDARMNELFNVTQNGKGIFTLPRKAFVRSIMLNHWYHHRGQLGVYLRILGAVVPSSYGPSGDELPNFSK